MTLLALPSYSLPWLSPCAPELFQLLLDLRVAVRVHIAGITSRPLLQLGWFAWALGTSNVSTLFANGGIGRDKSGLAFVAGASDSLLGWLVCQFISSFGRNRQYSPPLGLFFRCEFRSLLVLRLPLGVSRTLLAALVLTVRARLLRPVDGSTTMTAAMDTHPNRLLHSLHSWLWSGRRDPVVRVEGETVLCKQGTRSLLLQCTAIKLLCRYGWCCR
jgi:hypothetical protein